MCVYVCKYIRRETKQELKEAVQISDEDISNIQSLSDQVCMCYVCVCVCVCVYIYIYI
jgi:hypothetical protein